VSMFPDTVVRDMIVMYLGGAISITLLCLGVWKGVELVFDLTQKQCLCVKVQAQ